MDGPGMDGTDGMVRLTTAQAIVEFLKVQWSELDGMRRQLVAGSIGLFGHGNVVGPRAGPGGVRRRPAVLPVQERAVWGSSSHRVRQGHQPDVDARMSGIRRARFDQLRDGGRNRHLQPPSGAAHTGGHVHQGPPGSCSPADRGPGLIRHDRQRLAPSGQPVLRPDHPPRADPLLPPGGVPGPDRSGRDRGGHDLAASGHRG